MYQANKKKKPTEYIPSSGPDAGSLQLATIHTDYAADHHRPKRPRVRVHSPDASVTSQLHQDQDHHNQNSSNTTSTSLSTHHPTTTSIASSSRFDMQASPPPPLPCPSPNILPFVTSSSTDYKIAFNTTSHAGNESHPDHVAATSVSHVDARQSSPTHCWSVLGMDSLALHVLEWCDDYDAEAVCMVDLATWQRVQAWRQPQSQLPNKYNNHQHNHQTLSNSSSNSGCSNATGTDDRQPWVAATQSEQLSFSGVDHDGHPPTRIRTGLARYRYKRWFYLTARLCAHVEKLRQRPTQPQRDGWWPWATPFAVCTAVWVDEKNPLPTSFAQLFPELETLHFSNRCAMDPCPPSTTVLVLPLALRTLVFRRFGFSPDRLRLCPHPRRSSSNIDMGTSPNDDCLSALSASNANADSRPQSHSYLTCPSRSNLETVSFNEEFNASLQMLLCSCVAVRSLTLSGCKFNQPLSRLFPNPDPRFESLVVLELGRGICIAQQQQVWTLIKHAANTLTTLSIALLVPLPETHPNYPLHSDIPQLDVIVWPPRLTELTLDIVEPTDDISCMTSRPWTLASLSFRLPLAIQTLRTAAKMNSPLGPLELPSSLTCLEFGDSFNQPVSELVWPQTLRRLVFGTWFDQSLSSVAFPEHLMELLFAQPFPHLPGDPYLVPPYFTTPSYYKQPLDQLKLPGNLTTLCIDVCQSYGQSIGDLQLPLQLRHLTFGDEFNQSLQSLSLCVDMDFASRSSLLTLRMGNDFNQPVRGWYVPSSLRELYFGDKFNQPVDGLYLPETLQTLVFGSRFNQPLDRLQLPKYLRHLACGGWEGPLEQIHGRLPHTLTRLQLLVTSPLTNFVLPPNLYILILWARQNHPVALSPAFFCHPLPSSLTWLRLAPKLIYDKAQTVWPSFPESPLRITFGPVFDYC